MKLAIQVNILNLLTRACPTQGSYLFYGNSAHQSVHVVACSALIRGFRVLMVTGANQAMPYFVQRILRDNGSENSLENFLISRSFTCHQFHKTILEVSRERRTANMLILLGPSEILVSKDVKISESNYLCKSIIRTISGLSFDRILVSERPSQRYRSAIVREFWNMTANHILTRADEGSFLFEVRENGKNKSYLYTARPAAS